MLTLTQTSSCVITCSWFGIVFSTQLTHLSLCVSFYDWLLQSKNVALKKFVMIRPKHPMSYHVVGTVTKL